MSRYTDKPGNRKIAWAWPLQFPARKQYFGEWRDPRFAMAAKGVPA